MGYAPLESIKTMSFAIITKESKFTFFAMTNVIGSAVN